MAVSAGAVVAIIALVAIFLLRNRKSKIKSFKVKVDENPYYGEDDYYDENLNGAITDSNAEYAD